MDPTDHLYEKASGGGKKGVWWLLSGGCNDPMQGTRLSSDSCFVYDGEVWDGFFFFGVADGKVASLNDVLSGVIFFLRWTTEKSLRGTQRVKKKGKNKDQNMEQSGKKRKDGDDVWE